MHFYADRDYLKNRLFLRPLRLQPPHGLRRVPNGQGGGRGCRGHQLALRVDAYRSPRCQPDVTNRPHCSMFLCPRDAPQAQRSPEPRATAGLQRGRWAVFAYVIRNSRSPPCSTRSLPATLKSWLEALLVPADRVDMMIGGEARGRAGRLRAFRAHALEYPNASWSVRKRRAPRGASVTVDLQLRSSGSRRCRQGHAYTPS